MKRIINSEIVNPFTNAPIQMHFGFEKDRDGKFKRDVNNEPMAIERNCTTAAAIRQFINIAFPVQTQRQNSKLLPPSIEDSHHAIEILNVLRPFSLLEAALVDKQPKAISLDRSDYEWLLSAFKERSSEVFGIIAEVYIKAIENLEKIEEPAKKSLHAVEAT